MRKFLTLTLLILSGLAYGQTFEGSVTYSIDYISMPDEMAGFINMFPRSTTLYVKGKKNRMVQVTENVGTQIMIVDEQTRIGYMAIDQMNSKVYAKVPSFVLNEYLKPTVLDIDYTNEKSEIAGYNCKEALIQHGEGVERTQVWYATSLPVADYKDFKMLRGFPVAYWVKEGPVSIKYEASQIDQSKQSDSLFEIPEGYQEITWEEMVATGFSTF